MHGSRSDPDPYTMLYQCTFTTLNQCCQETFLVFIHCKLIRLQKRPCGN